MPLPSASVINNENQVKSDLGANIVLIGAPGSGKFVFLFFENTIFKF
jgi:hypothetical protein